MTPGKTKTPLADAIDIERQWLERPLARLLIQREIEQARDLLPDKYYGVGLQLGMPAGKSYFRADDESLRIFLGRLQDRAADTEESSRLKVSCDSEQLPLGRRAADLIIMPHTLDLSPSPIQVLREVSQVIDEDGILVLTGFNPASLIGFYRGMSKRFASVSFPNSSHTPGRVKEWLQLIGFEVYAGCYLDYLPPVSNARARKMLAFMDKAGERWWPVLASVYIIIAKKQTWKPEKVSMIASIRKRLNPNFAQPASRQRI